MAVYGSPFKPVDPLNLPYFHLRWFWKVSNFTQVPLQPSCANSWLKTPTFSSSHGSWPMVTLAEWEERLTTRNGGPTWPENCSLSPFVHQGLSVAKPRSSYAVCTLLPTSPCPASLTMLPVSTVSMLHYTASIYMYIICASLCCQYLHYLCFTMLPVSTLSVLHSAASMYIIYASLCCQCLHYLCFTTLRQFTSQAESCMTYTCIYLI